MLISMLMQYPFVLVLASADRAPAEPPEPEEQDAQAPEPTEQPPAEPSVAPAKAPSDPREATETQDQQPQPRQTAGDKRVASEAPASVSTQEQTTAPSGAPGPQSQGEVAADDVGRAEGEQDEVSPEAEPAEKIGPEFTFGALAFLRGEGRVNPDFNSSGGAEGFGRVLSRFQLFGRASWGPVAGFVQVKDSRVWGFEQSTASVEGNMDLHQGYLELGGEKDERAGWLRAGRQEIRYGRERLIGAFAWNHVGRSFDSLRLHGSYGMFDLDMFGAILQPMGVVSEAAPDPADPDLTADSDGAQLGGLQFSANVMDEFNGQLVFLGVRQDGRNGDVDWDRRIGNIGGRVWGQPIKGLTYDAEGHYQFGAFNGRTHSAWAWAAELAYLHGQFRAKPGVKLGYSMASGESCQNDSGMGLGCGAGESNEFFNFYPTNHIHYGVVDLMGWRNMRDLEVRGMLHFDDWFKSNISYHFFQLHDADGRWSNAGGASVGSGWVADNTRNNLGHEIDVVLVFTPWKPLMIQPGYGVFIPVDAGEAIAGPDPHHYAYLWVVAKF